MGQKTVSLKAIRNAKGVLCNLLAENQIYEPEKAKIIEAAVKILTEELERRKEHDSSAEAKSNRTGVVIDRIKRSDL